MKQHLIFSMSDAGRTDELPVVDKFPYSVMAWMTRRFRPSQTIVGIVLFFAILALAPTATVFAEDTTMEPTVSISRSGGCIVTDSGGLRCWGNMPGLTNNQTYPQDVSGMTNVKGVSVDDSGNIACIVFADNTMACGGNYPGNGTFATNPAGNFLQVSGLTDVDAAVVSSTSVCVLLNTGTVQCWGSKDFDGDNSSDYAPVSVAGVSGQVAEIARDGLDHFCLRYVTGGIDCIDRSNANANLLVVLHLPNSETDTYTKMDMHNQQICAATSTGAIRCWQISDPDNYQEKDVATDFNSGWQANFPSGPFADYTVSTHCALTVDGAVYCRAGTDTSFGGDGLGRSYYYDNGNGAPATELPKFLPPYGLNRDVTALHGGYHLTCADMTDGAVKCWGEMHANTPNTFVNFLPIPVPETTRADGAGSSGLAISKSSPNPTAPVAGQPVQYTIVVTNSSTLTQSNVTVTEEPAAGLAMTGFTSTPAGSCSTTNGTCMLTDPLGPGASATFLATFDVTASAGAVISNTAYVTSTQTPLRGYPAGTTPLVGVSAGGGSSAATTDLTVTKSAAATEATSGVAFDYTITVSNASNVTATNVRAVDTLPANVTFNSATAANGGSCTHSSGTVTCSWGSLAGGTATTATINVTPN